MPANPLTSKGARLERSAFLKKLRNLRADSHAPYTKLYLIDRLVAWILTRRKRYDARKGGLGRK